MLIVYFTHKTIYFQSRLVLCVKCFFALKYIFPFHIIMNQILMCKFL